MKIIENFPLKNHNTFGMDVKARYFAGVEKIEDLRSLKATGYWDPKTTLLLGGGSNILLTRDWDGLVIQNQFSGIRIISEDDASALVEAGAGENWHGMVLWALENKLGGIENLSLIPGTVGAAPMQNIGAYGKEIGDVFEYLEAYHIASGEIHRFYHKDCAFGYRESIFKNKEKGNYLILSVVLRLSKKPLYHVEYGDVKKVIAEELDGEINLETVSEAICRIRSRKLPDPAEIGNSGSFFKNPIIPKQLYQELKSTFPDLPSYPVDFETVKVPAGWLIDKAGWKGFRQGDAGVHSKQALVLVNYGTATGQEIWNLARAIQADILKRFGIHLQPEVNVY
jgi:UDP-N-acetylmuramate dehydrogenase